MSGYLAAELHSGHRSFAPSRFSVVRTLCAYAAHTVRVRKTPVAFHLISRPLKTRACGRAAAALKKCACGRAAAGVVLRPLLAHAPRPATPAAGVPPVPSCSALAPWWVHGRVGARGPPASPSAAFPPRQGSGAVPGAPSWCCARLGRKFHGGRLPPCAATRSRGATWRVAPPAALRAAGGARHCARGPR